MKTELVCISRVKTQCTLIDPGQKSGGVKDNYKGVGGGSKKFRKFLIRFVKITGGPKIFLQKCHFFAKSQNFPQKCQFRRYTSAPPPHTPWNSCKQSTSLDWTLQFRFVHLQTFAFNLSKSLINFQIFYVSVFIY
jgi:hypothetical protein